MEHIYDIVIVGGGPAGYTAALYAARSGLSTVVPGTPPRSTHALQSKA